MKNSVKIFYWTPRIICIIAILFISLFALDAFSLELSFWAQISGFLMHLIPSFILLAILILAWKKEFIGGILFMIIGLGLSPIVFSHNYRMNHSIFMSLGIILTITIPFVIVGVLFIISHFKRKKTIDNQ
ncbi:DUF7670 domain-containing protein [Gaetbulibacter saemankumensis]|uniref:DUF7670 domain-containing protein n=1 Tax=Gaetbulibacter saemankumensis TaxID=311208 RepID=UPI00040FD610|nr:hypothetical protein [Gaetbulibacter saemankumensis]